MAPIIRFVVTVTTLKAPEGGELVSSNAKTWATRDYTEYAAAVKVLDALEIKYVVTTEVIAPKGDANFRLG